jgi:hypothetical protein
MPPRKRRRTSAAQQQQQQQQQPTHDHGGSAKKAATGTYMPVSGLTREFPVDGVSASACCVGMQLPMSMFPGGNHKLRLGSYIKTPDNHRRMSLFLWLVHCAWGAGLTVYLETLIDWESYDTMRMIIQTRLRVFVPVSFHQVEAFLAMMQTTLEPSEDAFEAGSFGPAAWQNICNVATFMAAHEAASGCAMMQGITSLSYNCPSPEDLMMTAAANQNDDDNVRAPSPPYASSADGTDTSDDEDADESVAAATAAAAGQQAEVPMDTFARNHAHYGDNDDSLDEDDGFGQPPHVAPGPEEDDADDYGQVRFQSDNPITILSAKGMFNELLLDTDEALGVDAQQLMEAAYLAPDKLHFPEFSLSSATDSSLVYHMVPKFGGLVSSANALLGFNLPISQPSVDELRDSYTARLDSAGIETTHEILEARTIEELERAVEVQVSGRGKSVTSRPSLVESSDWPDLLGGGQYAFAHMEIWPTQALVQQRTAAMVSDVNEAVRNDKIRPHKAKSVVVNMLKSHVTLTKTLTDGVNPAFYKVWGDLKRLTKDIESAPSGRRTTRSQAATRANRIFYYVPKATESGEQLPFLSGMMVQLSTVGLMLNLTMAQLCAFLPIWMSGGGLLFNRFGLMVSWMLIGPPDTGKSETASRVIRCAPPGLRKIAHAVSARVQTHNREIGFHWRDEEYQCIATGNKGKAADPSALMSLSVNSLGYGAFSRFQIGDRAKGVQNDVETVMSEQRGIEISGSNQEVTPAAMSRRNVITMYNDTAESETHLATRNERALQPKDTPTIEGAASALQLIMCYANMGWMAQSFGAQQQSAIMMLAVRIFNGLVNKLLVPAGFPKVAPRELNKLQTHSVAVMQLRVSRYFETQLGLSLAERESQRALYMLKNQVVSFSDVLLAWIQLTQLSDTRAEEALIMARLKAKIAVEGEGSDALLKEPDTHPGYYLTTVRGTHGVAAECQELGPGIINTIINKLKYPIIGKAKLVALETQESRGVIAVLKRAVDTPQCLTEVQSKIIDFFVHVINNAPAAGARYWYPVVDENGKETGEIAFTYAIKTALLSPHLSALFQGYFGSIDTKDVQMAFRSFVSADCMRIGDNGSDDLSVTVVTPHLGNGPMVRPACSRGLLDPTTVLKGVPQYDASTDVPTVQERTEWATTKDREAPNVPVLTPKKLPNVCQIETHGALVVSPDVTAIVAAVEAAKYKACRMKPPPVHDHNEAMERSLNTFINAIMAISGEATVGQYVYTGSSTVGGRPFNLKRVGDFTETVTIANPRRGESTISSLVMGPVVGGHNVSPEEAEQQQQDDAERWARADPEEEFLPAGQPTVSFKKGDNLFAKMLRANARHNAPFDM